MQQQQQQPPAHYYSQDHHSQSRHHQHSTYSPCDSPLEPVQTISNFPQSQSAQLVGCDPRYVSGDIVGVNGNAMSVELDQSHHGQGRPRSFSSGQVSADQDAEGELDVEAELHRAAAGDSDQDRYDGDDDDYEDMDYDDERDGEFTLRNARRSTSTARRSLRSDRYNPYAYSSVSPYDGGDHGLTLVGRTRRAISNASTTSSQSSYPPLTPTSISSQSSSSRRNSAPSTSLPVPIPVPNLTKKSRGRRVPTVASLEYHAARRGDDYFDPTSGRASSNSKGARIHLCKVPGCGKCFARGEHLKRHVRSIHTYEKRQFTLTLAYLHITDFPTSSQVSLPWLRKGF